jgi:hypothetical protein
MWDFVMDKSGPGAGFLRKLPFPLPIYIPFASPQSSSLSPEAGTIGQEWPQCQQPHKKKSRETEETYGEHHDNRQLSRDLNLMNTTL